jgi:hypothetical protein
VRLGAHRRREALRGAEEARTIGTKLIEEAGTEVEESERVGRVGEELVIEATADPKREREHREADHLHAPAAVPARVDERGGGVVAGERDGRVGERPEEQLEDSRVAAGERGDDRREEELVPVKPARSVISGESWAGSGWLVGLLVCFGFDGSIKGEAALTRSR